MNSIIYIYVAVTAYNSFAGYFTGFAGLPRGHELHDMATTPHRA